MRAGFCGIATALIVGHRQSSDTIPPEQRGKLWLLGLIESIPIVAGGAFSISTDSATAALIAAGLAFSLTAAICWCFRNHTPATRIELGRIRGR
jgi:hypothetical protein